MRIFHVGMPKTGTTSIQAALDASRLNTVTELGWDVAGCRPDDQGVMHEWEGDGSWRRAAEAAGNGDVVISTEYASRTRPERIPALLSIARPDIVVVTHVPLMLALPRWYAELCKPDAANLQISYAEWTGATDWRSDRPDFDGIVARPDAVVAWWREAGAKVLALETTTNAVGRFFEALDLGKPPDVGDRNRSGTPTELDGSLEQVSTLVDYALRYGRIADMS